MSEFDRYPVAFEAFARVLGVNGGNPTVQIARGIASIVRQTEGTWLVTLEQGIPPLAMMVLPSINKAQAADFSRTITYVITGATTIQVFATTADQATGPVLEDLTDWAIAIWRLLDVSA